MTEKKPFGLVYVVDDDANVRKLVAVALKENGFEVHEFASGEDLLDGVKRKLPDLVILDWMMPNMDGLAVCGRLKLEKDTKAVPVIILTAKTEEDDCILGLEIGADDYLKKPFSVKELVTRVKAMLRRKEYVNPAPIKDEIFEIGDLKINVANRTVVKSGKFLNLTMKEFDLLVNLINERSKVMTREQLMSRVWSAEFSGDARTVDVHIRYLRQKIENRPESPVYVRTVRGIGYRIASLEELAG
ncbi:MAG: response regulator transcription factor [Oscillospiraceae bacterium]|jgi:two-component system alkaline phosphatase synthesis response regulator PhoP|nr:response regulator transcription factor [Oscillospiraceae bacterium]